MVYRIAIALFILPSIAWGVVQSPQGDITMSDFSGIGELANQGHLGQDAQAFQRGFGGPDPGPQYNRLVVRIQQALQGRGELTRPGSSNGIMDEQTIAAAKRVAPALRDIPDEQLAADPEAVAELVHDERTYDPTRVVTQQSEGQSPETEKVQQRLTQIGAQLEVDGIHGPQTDEAIRRWQTAAGLEPTGTLTQSQYETLVTHAIGGGTKEVNQAFETPARSEEQTTLSLLD